MQLYDKDLLSVQEVRELVEKAKAAQESYSSYTQRQVDALIGAVAEAGVRNARRLAALAHEETGFGTTDDKTIKNVFASHNVYAYIKDMKTIGELSRDEEKGLIKYAVPLGVIAALVPSTNPTSTVLYKALIALKAGNAIIFSPHPNARNCIMETVKVVRGAIAEMGGDENLVSGITIPTLQATDNLMKHRDIALILATGGSGMVRAAYSSGTPAIGVGPGNGPAYIEKTADVAQAVRHILESKTFDNGTICASEQSVVCDTDMEAAVRSEMERQGGYFLSPEQSKKLGAYILRASGSMNPEIVGKTAQTIALLAGIAVPDDAKVLIAKEDGIGRGHPYSNEKLAPILAFYTADDYVNICKLSNDILRYEGAGHTFTLHTKDPAMVDYFGKRIQASRIVVNSPAALGAIGATTGLMPALTLGCGAIGGSATSENVGPAQLFDTRYVAYGTRELADIKADLPDCSEGVCKPSAYGDIDIDAVVKEIMRRLASL